MDGDRDTSPRSPRAAPRLCAAIAAFALALLVTDVGCVFKLVTGLSCPGCGMTRAWLSALRLDLPAALAYHPLFWVAPVAIALAAAHGAGVDAGASAPSRALARAYQPLLVALTVLVLVVWVARLADGSDAGMLFGGVAPEGVPADVVGWTRPGWLALLGW